MILVISRAARSELTRASGRGTAGSTVVPSGRTTRAMIFGG